MMRPDDGAVDHVGASVSLDHLGQGLKHRVEHPGRDPTPVAAEDAVPLAVFIRQVTPLRSRARHPHHAFEIAAIVLRRAAPTSTLGRQQRSDQPPFLIRQPDPLAQRCLQMAALNQIGIPQSTFVHAT